MCLCVFHILGAFVGFVGGGSKCATIGIHGSAFGPLDAAASRSADATALAWTARNRIGSDEQIDRHTQRAQRVETGSGVVRCGRCFRYVYAIVRDFWREIERERE